MDSNTEKTPEIRITYLDKPFITETNCRNIIIQSLYFYNSQGHGIRFTNADHIKIQGCLLESLGQKGIVIGNERVISIENFTSVNQGCSGGTKNEVVACDFLHLGQGVVLICDGNRIRLEKAENLVSNYYFNDYSRIIRTYSPAIKSISCGSLIYKHPDP